MSNEWEVIAKTNNIYIAKKHEYIMLGVLCRDEYYESVEWNLSVGDEDLDWYTSGFDEGWDGAIEISTNRFDAHIEKLSGLYDE